MPKDHAPSRFWMALIITLGGLLAMGLVVLGPAPEAARPATGAMLTAQPTTTALPVQSASPIATPATPVPGAVATMPILAPTPTPGPTLAVTPDGQARRATVPILMYHYVGGLPEDADEYRVDLTVTPERFEAQLAYLQSAGYTSITLEDLVRHLAAGAPLPPKPVIFTFDDGYVDNFLYAFPLLRRYGFSGTFFVITQFLDEGTEGYMNWEQARLMQQNGMDIQAHCVSHEDMTKQPADALEQEIAGSKRAIEERLQKPVRFLAYPFGRYDSRVIGVLRANDYWGAVTTVAGVEHLSRALYALPRLRVHGSHDLDRFVAALDHYLP